LRQGNQNLYKDMIRKIVLFHREEYTEENLPTAESFILEMVNEALDEMYARENCVRDMSVMKHIIENRSN
ncbi:hypothetical protein OEK97_28155, partial [Escherichia coli]|uniref:hypothetical protein n=1 Tax=Escherichia coli TaxID=562 RepID=UPI0021DB0D1E